MRSKMYMAALVLFSSSVAAFASPITYNLTLTASAGSAFGGSGMFTVASAPTSAGVSTFTTSTGLSNLSFLIDGQTFNLANANSGTNTLVQFVNGTLNDITYAGTAGVNPNRFAFQSTGAYVFYYNNLQSVSTGTFTASIAPVSVTPEPSSIALLGTGLLGVAGVLRKRFV
ncbi:MAG: PEP-CTERM sorting domain-containing protein [Janthinobacterium lividum]